ncbi:MAG: LicD family protein [Lachnospiraceae bacterium]|nr:LicD family protein [Lachnospiraceae bacterium]
MLNFSEEFFQTQVREGFEVKSMMKKAWAGQLEVLEEIRKICARHDLTWFADYGTMLGAVRHRGFIPWDDDMDIGMTRDHLNAFVRYAKEELPQGYKILAMDLEPEYDSLIIRVVNGTEVSMNLERLEKYHGCPYVLGVDIFPYDYLSRNQEERELHLQLMEIILRAVDTITAPEISKEEVEAYLSQVEELTGCTIDRNKPLTVAMIGLAEKLGSIYGPEDGDEVTGIWRIILQKNYSFPKEWFAKENLVEMPFENVTVPVSKFFDPILTLKYGSNYMTPKMVMDHDYPFYKGQEEIFKNIYGYIPE